jgi:hypothetical protein
MNLFVQIVISFFRPNNEVKVSILKKVDNLEIEEQLLIKRIIQLEIRIRNSHTRRHRFEIQKEIELLRYRYIITNRYINVLKGYNRLFETNNIPDSEYYRLRHLRDLQLRYTDIKHCRPSEIRHHCNCYNLCSYCQLRKSRHNYRNFKKIIRHLETYYGI